MLTNTTALAAALCLAAGAATTLAQPAPPPPDHPLAGPAVIDNEAPGAAQRFAPAMQAGDGLFNRAAGDARANAIEARLFQRALRTLADSDDPNLSPAQSQKDDINEILTAFRDAQQAHVAEHRDELRELRAAARPQRDRAQRNANPGQPPEPNPERDAARQRLREINEAGPSISETNEQVWALLTPPQQEFITAEVERLRTQAQDRQNDRMRAGQPGQNDNPRRRAQRGQRPGADDMMMPLAPDGQRQRTGPEQLERRIERIRDIFDNLSPDEQQRVQQALDRMLDRIEDQLRQRDRRAEPPPMDAINVPGA